MMLSWNSDWSPSVIPLANGRTMRNCRLGISDLKKAPSIQLDQNVTKQALLDLYTVIDDYPESDRTPMSMPR